MIGILCILGFGIVALLTLAPRRGCQMPLSERLCRSLLLLAAWLERTATAWDCAIVRYRMERALMRIDMESTRQRLAGRAEA